MSELIAIVITFAVVSIWHTLATRKIRANQQFMMGVILHELDGMAHALGHRDFLDYLRSTKGEQYAQNASVNLSNLMASFTAHGVD